MISNDYDGSLYYESQYIYALCFCVLIVCFEINKIRLSLDQMVLDISHKVHF